MLKRSIGASRRRMYVGAEMASMASDIRGFKHIHTLLDSTGYSISASGNVCNTKADAMLFKNSVRLACAKGDVFSPLFI